MFHLPVHSLFCLHTQIYFLKESRSMQTLFYTNMIKFSATIIFSKKSSGTALLSFYSVLIFFIN